MITMAAKPTNLVIPSKYQDTEKKTETWKQSEAKSEKKVAVVYYLSRNGQLEHPHFIEVPLSSPPGLLLRDVICALNLLRGEGMASMYAWSFKRSYKNGFVWQDLSDNDLIYPTTQAHDYILKGSLLLESISLRSEASSTISKLTSEINSSSDDTDSPTPVFRRRNNSWSSLGGLSNTSNEQQQRQVVYKAKAVTAESACNASTQTDDERLNVKLIGVRTEHQKVGEVKRNRENLESLPNGNHQKSRIGFGEDEKRRKGRSSNIFMKMLGCGSSKKFNDYKH